MAEGVAVARFLLSLGFGAKCKDLRVPSAAVFLARISLARIRGGEIPAVTSEAAWTLTLSWMGWSKEKAMDVLALLRRGHIERLGEDAVRFLAAILSPRTLGHNHSASPA